MMTMNRLVAEWRSTSGKYYLRLERSPENIYFISHYYGKGTLGNQIRDDTTAIDILTEEIRQMLYQPDSHKRPMLRTF